MKAAIGEKQVKIYCYFWDGTKERAEEIVKELREDMGLRIPSYGVDVEMNNFCEDKAVRFNLQITNNGYMTMLTPYTWLTVVPGNDPHIHTQADFVKTFLSDNAVWKFPPSFIREVLKESK